MKKALIIIFGAVIVIVLVLSALDHIHCAVKEGAYNAGFKDGTEYVIEWLDKKRKWLKEHNGAFYDPAYFLEVLLEEYRDEHPIDNGCGFVD